MHKIQQIRIFSEGKRKEINYGMQLPRERYRSIDFCNRLAGVSTTGEGGGNRTWALLLCIQTR